MKKTFTIIGICVAGLVVVVSLYFNVKGLWDGYVTKQVEEARQEAYKMAVSDEITYFKQNDCKPLEITYTDPQSKTEQKLSLTETRCKK